MANNYWDEAEIKIAVDLAIEGHSAKAIAVVIKKTKNSVIGKMRRIGVPLIYKKPRSQHTVSRVREYRPRQSMMTKKIIAAKRRREKPKNPWARQVNDAAPTRCEISGNQKPRAEGVSFMDLQPHHCRWPFNEPDKTDYWFCGEPNFPNSSYCLDHEWLSRRHYET